MRRQLYVGEEPQDNAEDMYTLSFAFNGEFLKKLACASRDRHMSIEDYMYNCIIEGIGDKILDNEGRED